jgi:UDP-GlcNAc:undecaprenyl-phosphate/decaprenyl-phosphate GlcNAc-1-phosphate transferase
MVAVVAAALPITALTVWASLRSPIARWAVAAPGDARWHAVATPLVGGVGIFAGLVGGVGLAVAAGAVQGSAELWGVLAGCGLLFVAGLVDDVRGLTPLPKLAAQLGAVAIVLASGVQVEAVNQPFLATAIAVLWLVGMTNAMNLLDNMDGIAATLAAVACGLFAIDAVSAHPSRLVLVFALAIGCACLGFIPFNLRPRWSAAAFMGDSGSQVLGFALGSLALLSTWKAAAPSLATVLLPVLVLAIPILDTTLVTVMRLVERRPVAAGGRDHTSHRLVYGGLSEGRTVILLATLAAAVGATGLAYSAVDSLRLTLAGVLVTFAVLAQFSAALAGVGSSADGRGETSIWHALELRWGRAAQVVADSALVAAAFAASYVVRFGGLGTAGQRELFADALPVILASRLAVLILFGVYTSRRGYAGARAAARIVAAVVLSEGIAVGLIAMSDENAFAIFSRSVFAIDAVFCSVALVASRVVARAFAPRGAHPGPSPALQPASTGGGGTSSPGAPRSPRV